MTRPNATRLVGVYQWARDNPREHNQLTWGQRTSCATALCIAGKVVSDDATPDQLVWTPDAEDIELGVDPIEATWWLRYVEVPHANPIDGSTVVTVFARAMELLGLTGKQANDLFAGGNLLADIRRLIAGFIGIDPDAGDAFERAAGYDATTAATVFAVLSPDSPIAGADAIAACTTPAIWVPQVRPTRGGTR